MNNRVRSILAIPIIIIIITLFGISFIHAASQLHKEALIYDKQQTPFATPQLLPTYTPTPLPSNKNISFPILNPPPELETNGNQLLDMVTKKTVQLVGVSDSSLEYNCQGNGHLTFNDFMTMRSWGINTVRIPLSSQFFLAAQSSCPPYSQTVFKVVTDATNAGLYVIISLQWDAPFGDNISLGGSQYPMPDAKKDVIFWQNIANLFRPNPNVMFDLFSEPHDVNFQQWYHGGPITISDANDYRNTNIPQLVHGTYQSIGMKDLVELIRNTSPNLIIVSGTDWGFDLEQLNNPQYTFPEDDVLFATHLWDHANEQADTWNQMFLDEQSRFPIIVTEMGEYDCQTSYISKAIPILNQYKISWLGWTWSVGNCLNNSALLKSWDGTPNSPYSEFLRQQILNTVDQQG